MTPYPYLIIQVSFVNTYIRCLNDLSFNVSDLLLEEGLTTEHFSNPEDFVLEYHIYCLLDKAAEQSGDLMLGFTLAKLAPFSSYGDFYDKVTSHSTLEEGLLEFINQVNKITNCCNYWLEEKDGFLWICRPNELSMQKGLYILEQHVIALFIDVVRQFKGKPWKPSKVKVSSTDNIDLTKSTYLSHSKIEYNQPYTALSLPAELDQAFLMNSATIDKETKVPADFINTLKILLKQNYFGKQPSRKNVAECLNISVRTLHRRIEAYGKSFQQLVQDVQLTTAKEMLLNKKSNIEIAEQLGYTSPQNFNRAFKAMTGMPPLKYKKQLINKL